MIQAYVADSTDPKDRARALGWLSATTNLGVALGPVLGSFAITLGKRDLMPGAATLQMGHAAPGIMAAALCLLNIIFAARYLTESRDATEHEQTDEPPRTSRQAVWRVISHSSEPSSRLIWIYAIAIGAFQGSFSVLALFLNARFQVTELTIGYFFMYVGAISVFTRVLLLGRMVDWLGEAKLSRLGLVLLALGVLGMPLARNLPMLAIAVALIPLGYGLHISVCDVIAVERDSSQRARALHGDATDVWRRISHHRAALLRVVVRFPGRVVAITFSHLRLSPRQSFWVSASTSMRSRKVRHRRKLPQSPSWKPDVSGLFSVSNVLVARLGSKTIHETTRNSTKLFVWVRVLSWIVLVWGDVRPPDRCWFSLTPRFTPKGSKLMAVGELCDAHGFGGKSD